MNVVAKAGIVLVGSLLLGAGGCTVHWVVPVVEEAPAEPEEEAEEGDEADEPSADAEEDDGTNADAVERATRERAAREAGGDDEEEDGEARDERERRGERDDEEVDDDAVRRAEAERAAREGDADDEDAVERARAEREEREAAGEEDGAQEEGEPEDGDADDEAGEPGAGDGDPPEEGDEPEADEPEGADPEEEPEDEKPEEEQPEEDEDADKTAGPDEGEGLDPDDPARRRVDVPPGHLPPEGLCRIWYDGIPPGLQAPPAPCDELLDETLADGAFVLYGDEDWDLEFDWEAVEAAHPGAVPAPVLALRRSYAERGDDEEADELPEPREIDVPDGQFPRSGLCRVWIEGIPAGQQAGVVVCDTLVGTELGDEAFLLYDGRAWDAAYDWARAARRDPGSVPEVVLEVLGS